MYIILRDKAAASATTELKLPIDINPETRQYRWRQQRTPALPPRRSSGALDFSHFDPEVDFTWVMDDWSMGGLQPYWRDGSNRYASANGIDARGEGVLMLAPQILESHGTIGGVSIDPRHWGGTTENMADFIIRNPGAEQAGATTGWTAGTGVTLTADTDSSYVGDMSFKLATDGGMTTDEDLMKQSLANPAVFQGQIVRFSVWLKRVTSGGTGAKLTVYDGVDTTRSSASTDSSYAQLTVTHTVSGSATEVTVSISSEGNEGDVAEWRVDSFIYEPTTALDTTVGYARLPSSSAIYATAGEHVLKWNTSNNVWDVVHFSPEGEVADDITHFNGNIFVAFGDGAMAYGSDTTWTTSTLTIHNLKKLTVAADASGVPALWASSTTTGLLHSSTNPVNGGTEFSTGVQVGGTGGIVRALSNAFDSVQVFKSDNLYIYTRFNPNSSTGDNLFAPVYTGVPVEFTKAVHPTELNGWLYFIQEPASLLRWTPGQSQDLTSLFSADRVPSTVGKLHGLTAVDGALWIAARDNEDANGVILALSEDRRGIIIHPMYKIELNPDSAGYVMGVGDRHLFIGGVLPSDTTVSTISAIGLPAEGRTVLNTIGNHYPMSIGTLDSSIWHGNLPATQKAFLAVTVWGKNIDSNHTVQIQYGLDGAAPTTNLTTLNTSASIYNAYLSAGGASGRTIQLRVTATNNADSTTPQIWAIVVHSTIRLERLRTWEVFVRVAEEEWEGEYQSPHDFATIITNLNTLEDQVVPIVMEHGFNGHTREEVYVHLLEHSREQVSDNGTEVHRLVLQEVNVS